MSGAAHALAAVEAAALEAGGRAAFALHRPCESINPMSWERLPQLTRDAYADLARSALMMAPDFAAAGREAWLREQGERGRDAAFRPGLGSAEKYIADAAAECRAAYKAATAVLQISGAPA